jgi:hypothetical protein
VNGRIVRPLIPLDGFSILMRDRDDVRPLVMPLTANFDGFVRSFNVRAILNGCSSFVSLFHVLLRSCRPIRFGVDMNIYPSVSNVKGWIEPILGLAIRYRVR